MCIETNPPESRESALTPTWMRRAWRTPDGGVDLGAMLVENHPGVQT
jgi:hypothetical protein